MSEYPGCVANNKFHGCEFALSPFAIIALLKRVTRALHSFQKEQQERIALVTL